MAMKRLKTAYAGAIIERALYDAPTGREGPKERAQKSKASSEAQRRMNIKNACHQFELRIALNFPTAGSARFYTLTYDEAHLPRQQDPKDCRKQVLRDKDSFLRAVRGERQKAGKPTPRAAWCIEVLTAEGGRWHLHVLLDSTGDDDETVRRCWRRGSVDVEPLRVDQEKNHETLARYMTKEMRELQDRASRPGQHVWGFTRNCLKVEYDSVLVPEDYRLDVPEGCEVLADRSERTEFACWHFQKLRVGAAAFPKPPRAKRRRRRA